jgi:hypothetical protein
MKVQDHLMLLGMPCKDRVTGMLGTITSISFDLYGCVQAIVHPGLDEKGELKDTLWFDVARLEITGGKPVMDRPNFEYGYIAEGKKGPAEKPSYGKS